MIDFMKKIIICSFFIVITFIGIYITLNKSSIVKTDSIAVGQIQMTNHSLKIKGDTSNSSTGFSGYQYRIENGNLYLQLEYSIVSKSHLNGAFDIEINKDLKKINKVYLEGNTKKDIVLIWEKNKIK